ncbi:hypothetical protein BDR07DRAFT_1381017 [Suillus spraguei]|nr:hypothetical protein BDR07DRAFT_1381017 [Suillus spraguei]
MSEELTVPELSRILGGAKSESQRFTSPPAPEAPCDEHLDSDDSPSSGESLHAPGVLSGQVGPLCAKKRLAWHSALSVRDEHKFMELLSRPYGDHSSDTEDGTMDQQVFSCSLEHFDQDGVCYVITYKEAAHETQWAHYAVSQWEMEEASQLRHLQPIYSSKEVETFVNMLVDGMDDQVTNDLDYLNAHRESELAMLKDHDKDLNTLEEHVFHTGAPKLLSL